MSEKFNPNRDDGIFYDEHFQVDESHVKKQKPHPEWRSYDDGGDHHSFESQTEESNVTLVFRQGEFYYKIKHS